MSFLRSVWCLIGLVLGILTPEFVYAQQSSSIRLPAPCTITAVERDAPADILAHPDRFDCSAAAKHAEGATVWTLFKEVGLPPLQNDVWVFKHRYGRVKAEKVWFRYDDGTILPSPTSDLAAVQRFSTADLVFKAPGHDAAVTDILVRLDGFQNVRGVAPLASVEPAADMAVRAASFRLFYGLFVGMMFVTLLYALLFFMVLKHRFLLAYASFAASVMLFGLSWSGGLASLIGPMTGFAQAKTNFLAVALCSLTATFFFTAFVGRQFIPRLAGRILTIASMLPIFIVIVRSVDYDWHWRAMDTILLMAAALNAAGLAVVAIMAILRGSQPARLFLLGWSMPVLVAVVRLLWAVDVVQVQSDLFDISFFLALIAEIIVSSAGIVLRVRQLRVERDAAQLRELGLRELAETDALTGLLNRRSFLERCMEGEDPKRLILIDVDHFKDVNDRYGHLTGDDVLTELAACLRHTIPPGAILGRLGGEEFGIALRADLAPTLPQVIRKRVADTHFPHGLKLTVSVGHALGQIADDLSWKAIYSAADQALIAAKHAGRNRVHRRAVPIAA